MLDVDPPRDFDTADRLSTEAYRDQRVKFMSQLVKAKSWLTGTI